jgi:hypothetical protein
MSFVDNLKEGDRYFVSVEDCHDMAIFNYDENRVDRGFLEFSFLRLDWGGDPVGFFADDVGGLQWVIDKDMAKESIPEIDVPKILDEVLGEEKPEAVNHPSHYNMGKIEVIDAIEDWQLNFNRGSMIKYIARAGRKDPAKEKEDLEKARFYLDREIAALEEK